MTDTDKKHSPPYATFSSFMNFINGLRDNAIPSRIDPSVFGNASGSIIYSVLASLRFLKLIDEDGTPSQRFIDFVNASDEERKPLLATLLKENYPSLFEGKLELASATSSQFDEIIRDEYGVAGSTIDKIAAFFVAAAKQADVTLSPHIQKRRAIAASKSSRKSTRQRKPGGEVPAHNPPPPPPAMSEKQLEYRLVDLMSEAVGKQEVMDAIIKVITFLKTKDVAKSKADDQ